MWRETKKAGIYRHDDSPCCKIEILNYHCDDCGTEQTTYHRVGCDDATPGHEPATKDGRQQHGTCACGASFRRI